MQRALRVLRILVAVQALRIGWRRSRSVRLFKLVAVIALGIGAVAIIAAVLRKMREEIEPPAEPAFLPDRAPADRERAPEIAEPPASARPPRRPVAVASPPAEAEVLADTAALSDATASPSPKTEPSSVEPDAGKCPGSHPVKAVKRSGVYHTDQSPWYERSKADICFKDAASAEAAGFRAAKRQAHPKK